MGDRSEESEGSLLLLLEKRSKKIHPAHFDEVSYPGGDVLARLLLGVGYFEVFTSSL